MPPGPLPRKGEGVKRWGEGREGKCLPSVPKQTSSSSSNSSSFHFCFPLSPLVGDEEIGKGRRRREGGEMLSGPSMQQPKGRRRRGGEIPSSSSYSPSTLDLRSHHLH